MCHSNHKRYFIKCLAKNQLSRRAFCDCRGDAFQVHVLIKGQAEAVWPQPEVL